MQEADVPVTYGYISDIHEKNPGQTGCTTASATGTGYALGPVRRYTLPVASDRHLEWRPVCHRHGESL